MGIPTTEKVIRDAENELNIKFDNDYIFFQINYGGSIIKTIEIFGINNSELMADKNIVEMTKSYRKDENSFSDWLIIGSSYTGDSIGLNKDGQVLVFDHDYGELIILANTFENYILDELER